MTQNSHENGFRHLMASHEIQLSALAEIVQQRCKLLDHRKPEGCGSCQLSATPL